MLTLSRYKPCCFSNTNYFVIILTWFWSLWQLGHLQPHSKSKAWHLSTQLYLAAINNIWKEVFLFPFWKLLRLIKPRLNWSVFLFMTFKNLFKASKIRERVPLISRITQEWEVVFYIWKWNIANTCKHFRMQLLLTHAAVTNDSFCKKEGEKEMNEVTVVLPFYQNHDHF